MRKITLLFSLLLAFAGRMTVSADNFYLSATNGLPGTASNNQYTFESEVLTASQAAKVIRLSFVDSQNHAALGGYKFVCISEFYLLDKDGNEIDLTVDNFSTNAQETSEGPMENICDGNTAATSFWHSKWSGAAVNDYHYLEIAVPDGTDLTEFKLKWITRNLVNAPTDLYVTTGTSAEVATQAANILAKRTQLENYIEKAQTTITNNAWDTELCATLQNIINNLDKSNADAMQASITSFQEALKTPQENTTLTGSDGLPGTFNGSYYHWDSPVITLPSAANKLRFTVSKTNTGATFNSYVFFTIGEFYLYDADGNQVTLTADKFSTNAQHSTEGPLANICDGNQATYFHSRYQGDAVPGGLHYIEIQLPQPMSTFKFSFDSRNGNNVPTTITVSTDKGIVRKDLVTAITTAESYKDSWNDVWRIGAGYNNYTQAEGDEDFVAAVNDVKAFNDNIDASTTAEQIQAQIDRLNTLISHLSINLPVNNSFLRIRCVDGLRRILSSVAAEGSSAGRAELANTVDANSIFYYADNKLLAYTTGQYLDDKTYTAVGEEANTVGFTAASNGNVGSYNFFINHKTLGTRYQYGAKADLTMDSGYGTNADNGYCWWLEGVKSLPVTFTKNFATLWTPVALTIPAGVTAYTATLNAEGDALTLNQLDGTIPANTGVLLYTENIDTYNFDITTDVDGVEKGSLTGQANTILASSVENNVFTLQTVEDEMGFKNYTGENLNGFKARLETSSASAAQAIRLIFGADDTTGINGVTTADKANAAIYDLSGRRVAQPAKGIYIVGGKKVLFK